MPDSPAQEPPSDINAQAALLLNMRTTKEQFPPSTSDSILPSNVMEVEFPTNNQSDVTGDNTENAPDDDNENAPSVNSSDDEANNDNDINEDDVFNVNETVENESDDYEEDDVPNNDAMEQTIEPT